MALRNQGTAAPVASPAKFEDEDTVQADVVEQRPEPAYSADTDSKEAAQVSTAIATRSAGTVAAFDGSLTDFAAKVAEMKNGADFGYGAFANQFKAIQGAIKGVGDSKGKTLGRWAKVNMTAWQERVEVSPGSDAKSAKDYVAYSDDKVTISYVIGEDLRETWIGRPVAEYVAWMKKNDYPNAGPRDFVDIAALIEDCESSKDEFVGELAKFTLSSSSIPSFRAYSNSLTQKAKLIQMGAKHVKLPADPFTFFLQVEAASKGDNEWTKLKVVDRQPKF